MPTRYFRAGVGTVIYNEVGEIAIFKRAQPPVGVWELQQGGIDLNESPGETLWRELQEETGLTQEDIDHVCDVPGWTVYHRPVSLIDHTDALLGQAHCWFFLKLKSGRSIDLSKATQEEASECRWTNFDDLISLTGEHKKHVYESLKNHFQNHIRKQS